ncbi:MAG: DNA polymerase III subunit delta [Clostridia bacterium]|nr:DNA polymerase III subunit delta [Clostridia bacterium]
MDINEFKSRLKDGKLEGIYIFAGEEEYLIRHYLSSLRSALNIEPAFAVFNNPVFDGDEVDFSAISEAIKAPPMMSDYKLVEWRHADFDSMGEKELSLLEALIEEAEDYPYSIIAFTSEGEKLDFGTQKKPSKFVSRFGKRLNLLRFEKSTDNQLYSWLKKHFDARGVSVTLDTVRALVFRSGHSMNVLYTEVEKLTALALARGRDYVTVDDVNEVSASTPESETFALSNAITERNKQKAYAALEELKIRRVDPGAVMGMVARTYDELLSVAMLLEEGKNLSDIESLLKMNPYKVKIHAAAAKRYSAKRLADITNELARVDAGSKFGGVSGYTAIEIFISKSI